MPVCDVSSQNALYHSSVKVDKSLTPKRNILGKLSHFWVFFLTRMRMYDIYMRFSVMFIPDLVTYLANIFNFTRLLTVLLRSPLLYSLPPTLTPSYTFLPGLFFSSCSWGDLFSLSLVKCWWQVFRGCVQSNSTFSLEFVSQRDPCLFLATGLHC